MEFALYTISFIAIVLSLVATIWVARKPGEAQYDAKAKGNLSRLTWIYSISTLVSLIIFVLFLYML